MNEISDEKIKYYAKQQVLEEILKQEDMLNDYEMKNKNSLDLQLKNFIRNKRDELEKRKRDLGLGQFPNNLTSEGSYEDKNVNENERDRRLRLRAEERARRMAGFESIYNEPNSLANPRSNISLMQERFDPEQIYGNLNQSLAKHQGPLRDEIPRERQDYADKIFQEMLNKKPREFWDKNEEFRKPAERIDPRPNRTEIHSARSHSTNDLIFENSLPPSNYNKFDKNQYKQDLLSQISQKQQQKQFPPIEDPAPDPFHAQPASDINKKLKYREELQKQIEENRRRKEEEKKLIQMQDVRYEMKFSDQSQERSIRRQKTIDPNKPSDENPHAERYREFAKHKSIGGEEMYHPKISENSFDNREIQQFSEFPSPRINYSPSPHNQNSFISQQPEINQSLTESYLKEIQEIKQERDKARECMLEMKEMMLKEREKQIENMITMLRIQSPMNPYQAPLAQYPVIQQNPAPLIQPNPVWSRPQTYQADPMNNQRVFAAVSTQLPYYANEAQTPKPDFQSYGPKNDDLIDVNPIQTNYLHILAPQEPEVFESSLRGHSKFVPTDMNWGNLHLYEITQLPKTAEIVEKSSKIPEIPNFLPKTSMPNPTFKENPIQNLKNIEANDESLPSNIEFFQLRKSQMEPVKIVIQPKIEENKFEEESIDEAYSEHFESDIESEPYENEIVTPVYEIEMGVPKFGSFEEFSSGLVPNVQETPRAETRRLILDKPKTIDIFNKKSKITQKTLTPKTGSCAFSRLEEARKHANEQESLDLSEEMDKIFEENPKPKLQLNQNFYDEMIDGGEYESSYDSRPGGNYFGYQKNDSSVQDSGLLDIGKLVSEIPIFGFGRADNYEGSSSGLRSGSGQRSLSRRYEEDYDL
ncbi:unnamed protein product [Blepharisma stoltei]|uniref:Uncharacterized protein n=1 Tax=Blepharisma stoltei TaxID=1481888 RepID=A0AAU9JAC6_9CILI|nr:unnamed protein product [Blepharisma stoltei]